MGNIHVLTPEISNKIAAGEVVERPASVVKELVENSIDAGSTVITVEIKHGGSTYIRVSDNGKGMSAEDAKICFLRHATSKIQHEEDLDAIYTLGFRGEALSSIGAVSKTMLYTKRNKDSEGVCVSCEGGEILTSCDAGTPDGTTIVVENLFYNTPARMKFLKKDSTEAGYINDIISRFIFAHPEISFRLIINGKDKLFSPGDASLKNAVYTVYGRDYANASIETEYEYEGIRVSGIIGKGHVSRPNRNYQSFFVNKRYIKSPMITRAVEEAYKNQVMIGKFPMAVLNVEINPELIDINVHPTKLEVKFSDEKSVYHSVYYAVKNALYALPDIPKAEIPKGNFQKEDTKEQFSFDELIKNLPKDKTVDEDRSFHKAKNNPFVSKIPKIHKEEKPSIPLKKQEDTDNSEEILNTNKILREYREAEKFRDIPSHIKVSDYAKENDVNDLYDGENPKQNKSEEKAEVFIKEKDTKKEQIPPEPIDEYFKIVGQIFDTYIIFEKDDAMYIIDQHAAHERLCYEEIKKSYAERQILSQMLLEPVIVRLGAGELDIYRENADFIRDAGFDAEEFGDNEIILRSVPSGVEWSDAEDLILELIEQLENSKQEIITKKNERALYTIACKAAVKGNTRMYDKEMENLVKSVLRLKSINTCPHGRPIMISMTKKDLEKDFKRIL